MTALARPNRIPPADRPEGGAEKAAAVIGITLGGTDLILDPSGALWLPSERLLVVADLHFEKASSFARGKTYLPPYDSQLTLVALTRLIMRRAPARVICLGDSFHDPGGPERFGPGLERLKALQCGRDWIWISGNHDPDLPATLGGDRMDCLALNNLRFRHLPGDIDRGAEIVGHYHPVGKIRQRGRTIRRRAFVTDGLRLVLPAFGALTGGLNVMDPAFARILNQGPRRTFLLGDHQVYPMAPGRLRPDRQAARLPVERG